MSLIPQINRSTRNEKTYGKFLKCCKIYLIIEDMTGNIIREHETENTGKRKPQTVAYKYFNRSYCEATGCTPFFKAFGRSDSADSDFGINIDL